MCEFCRESWSEETAVIGFPCEFISEESMDLCSAPAVYQLKERYVEDHFCEQHGQKEAVNLADGLTENMQLIGLSEGETLKEITEPTACYRCGNSAKYAQITMTTTYLRSGQIPHVYFGWTEGNPLLYLLKYVAFGQGDIAPVTHEVLRQAKPDPAQRPVVHIGG